MASGDRCVRGHLYPAIVSESRCVGGAQVFLKLNHGNMSPDAAKLAERVALNMLEQAPVFFVCMWLHCAYVDAVQAGYLGLAYVVTRIMYQLTYSYFGTFTVIVEYATQPRRAPPPAPARLRECLATPGAPSRPLA